MTRDEIMKLEGRELDYKIAKEIFDLDCLKDPPYGTLLPVEVLVEEYSTKDTPAMRVAHKMAEKYYVDIGIDKYGAQVQINY